MCILIRRFETEDHFEWCKSYSDFKPYRKAHSYVIRYGKACNSNYYHK